MEPWPGSSNHWRDGHEARLWSALLLMRDMPNWVARLALVIATSWLAYFNLYQTHWELHMVLTPLIVMLALAASYVLGRARDDASRTSK